MDEGKGHAMGIEAATRMRVSELSFDVANPRLTEFDLTTNSTEQEIIQILWDAMDVREIVMSIAASGFFQHEPVIVARENGKNIVIEGNRRLAAVKVLLNPELASILNIRIPDISDEIRRDIRRIPTLQSTREQAWRYLGFKHVNGPAKWGSYAKSRYIADVHRSFGVALQDIAGQIGDTHQTVQRLFRGLMVIEQAERLGVFTREDRWRGHFSFSYLYTGLDYVGIRGFLGLRPATDESTEPVPPHKKEELRELCLWLYGSKREDTEPIVRSQNPYLRRLDMIVRSTEATAALRAGYDIDHAYEISRPSSTVFEEALFASKRSLEKARGLLSTGYDGSEELFRLVTTILDLTYDLYEEMERKRTPRRKKRTTRDD